MKRGYPYTNGNLNFGYEYNYSPKSSKGGGSTGGDGKPGPVGPRGPTGNAGPVGPTGEKGDKGDLGPRGPKGDSGLKGDPGNRGPKGDVGPQGLRGLSGPQGPQGLQGLRGDNGTQGPQGLQGPQGIPGSAAHKGDKGDKGEKGDRGLRGPAGPKGIPGPTGPQGNTGLAGQPGATGPAGAKGDKGDKGNKGDVGNQGHSGNPGPQGAQGQKGDTGIRGPTGPTGPKGSKGDTGARGNDGNPGQIGPAGPSGPAGPTGNTGAVGKAGPAGATGPVGAKGNKGDKGDKGAVGNFDDATKKELILINKDFGKVTYPNTFQSFEFVDSGNDKPYNQGYGTSLVITKSTTEEQIPILGLRAPIKITQTRAPGDQTEISFVGKYSETNEFGVIFAIQDLTNGAAKTVSVTFGDDGGVYSDGEIRQLGTLDHNGNTYEYYLIRAEKDSLVKAEFDIEFLYTSSDLPKGKMAINIYGGFTFLQLSAANYRNANLTDKLHFPYHKDYEKQKFKGIMKGNILLAGFEQQDGTILPNDKLKIAKTNLESTLANTILQYVTKNILKHTVTCSVIMTSPSQTLSGWCYPKSHLAGYPAAMYPLINTNTLHLTILTHTFDDDSAIIDNNLELEFRLLLYTAGTDTQVDDGTPAILGTINYWHSTQASSQIKRSEKHFRINHTFTYKPPQQYIGYSIQFRQIKPIAPLLGNESDIVFTGVQIPD